MKVASAFVENLRFPPSNVVIVNKRLVRLYAETAKSYLCRGSFVNCSPADSQMGRRVISRDQIIKLSLDYIKQNLGLTIRVGELAEAADCSERTIRSAFKDWFGIL